MRRAWPPGRTRPLDRCASCHLPAAPCYGSCTAVLLYCWRHMQAGSSAWHAQMAQRVLCYTRITNKSPANQLAGQCTTLHSIIGRPLHDCKVPRTSTAHVSRTLCT